MAIITKYGIRVVSYVHRGDELVDFDELTPEEHEKAAMQVKLILLNEMFRGKATFFPTPEGQEPGEVKGDGTYL